MVETSVTLREPFLIIVQFVHFTRGYNTTPSVHISANHSTTASGNLAPVHNGISTWIEVRNLLLSRAYHVAGLKLVS